MYYVYILQSTVDHTLYTGYTHDLQKRFQEHNAGQSVATRQKKPFVLVYYEAFASKHDAIVRERKLKQHKNGFTVLKKRIANSLNKAK